MPAPLAASGGRAAGQLAAAATRLRQPLNGGPTSILIVALDHLADGDADAVIVANSNGIGPALLARDNRKRRLVMQIGPALARDIANVAYVEGRLVMQIARIGLKLANMFS